MSGELVKVDNLTPIPIGKKDSLVIAQDVGAQIELLSQKTPTKFVKKRPGKGGMVFDYVEVNYVTAILNAVFRFDWDLDVIETKIDEKNRMIAMLVELRVRFADGREVKKKAWGGSEIKYLKGKDQKLDFANDLKSAQSDGLKKAGSMINIAWDVYSGITKSKDPEPPKREENEVRRRGTEDPRKAEMDPFADNGEEVIDVEEEEEHDPSEVYKFDFIHKGKKYRFTKFEILKYFQEAKKNLGSTIYYTILGEFGFEKSNQIPMEKNQEIFDKMVDTWKNLEVDRKAKKVEDQKEKEKKEEKVEEEFQEKVGKEAKDLQKDIKR